MRAIKVLNTRPLNLVAEFSLLLSQNRFEPVELPLVELTKVKDSKKVIEALKKIQNGDFVFVSSANTVRFLCEIAESKSLDLALLMNQAKIFCVGNKTKNFLEKQGLKVSYVPRISNINTLVNEFLEVFKEHSSSKKIFFFRGEISNKEVVLDLKKRDFSVEDVICYQNNRIIHPSFSLQEKLDSVDVLTFLSAQSIRDFVALLEPGSLDALLEKLKTKKCFVIGEGTFKVARDYGFTRVSFPKEQSIEALVTEIALEFPNHE